MRFLGAIQLPCAPFVAHYWKANRFVDQKSGKVIGKPACQSELILKNNSAPPTMLINLPNTNRPARESIPMG